MRKPFTSPFFWVLVTVSTFFFYTIGTAQTIHTIAGTVISSVGIPGYGGDGGPATAALLRHPVGLDVDSIGCIYIADVANRRIRKINTTGIINTIAGTGAVGFSGDGGPATAASFDAPFDLVVDKRGNLYICDYLGTRIRKIDTAGIITTVAGNGITANTGDGGPATNASIYSQGIAVDTAGNIYIAAMSTIRKVNTTGIINSIAGTGVLGFSGDGGPATGAEISAMNLAVDRNGNIYFAGNPAHRLRKIDASGIINTIAGSGIAGYSGDGGPATAAQIGTAIEDVTIDYAGNIYFSDRDNSRVRKINTLGVITTIAGNGMAGYGGDGGPATAAYVDYLGHIAKYGSGNLYFADRNNHVIRMITDTNHAVTFTGSSSLVFNVCAPSVSIDSLLTATDADTGEVDNWNLFYGPFHGSVTPTYATYTTGGTMLPTGLTYTPTPGYVGFDTFSVRVSDGYTSDSTTIYVRVDTTLPYAGGITGADSVCMGDTIMLADTITGGAWSVTSAHASVSSGIVTGLTTGADTIRYIVTNACGADTATHAVYIKACPDAVPLFSKAGAALHIKPNPGNGRFVIKLSSPVNEQAHVLITDIVGAKVRAFTTTTNLETEVTLTVPTGIYVLSVTTQHSTHLQKVVVQ